MRRTAILANLLPNIKLIIYILQNLKYLIIFIQIAQAIQYLHKHNIIHRDIKTANIFIDNNNKLKLGDFGIVKILSGSYEQTNTVIGTPLYMSPELYRNQRYNTKIDIWSLGCVLYEIMTYTLPFIGKTLVDLKYKIFAGKYNCVRLKIYSPELRNIVALTLNTNPQTRPTINQLLNLPLINMKITITNNYHIKPLFFEPYNIPKKPSDWNAIIKKYAQPIQQLPSTSTIKPLPPSTIKPLPPSTIKPLPQIYKNPTYIIPHPPQKPKPSYSRPHIKLTPPTISPIYNQPLSNQISQNIKINIPINKKSPENPIQNFTLILSNNDNNELIQLDKSINKLQQNIKELNSLIDIKSYRVKYLKDKRQKIIENNKNALNIIKNNKIHLPLIPIQPFKKITQEISISKDQISMRKNIDNLHQIPCPNSKLIIKIGSKHDSNYFLNQ